MNKYISSYSKFIFEQDLGPIPGAEPGGAPAKTKEKKHQFIFIDDMEDDAIKKKKYPDGSTEVQFPSFLVTDSEMEEWVKKNILSTDKNKLSDHVLDLRRKNLTEIVKGKKVNIAKEDSPFIEKLKNAVSTDIFGSRGSDVMVIFDVDGRPTTDEIDVTFIKI